MKLSIVDPVQTRGLRLFMVGLSLAAAGFGIAFFGSIEIGWYVIWVGGLLGMVGLGWHFLIMFLTLTKQGDPQPKSHHDKQ